MTFEKKREGPTTTLAVHRCRFVDYAPSAITALAFPPLPLPSIKGKKKSSQANQGLRFGVLAVGHANGNIDLCEWTGSEQDRQSSQAWVVKQTLSGPYPSKVDSLAFVLRHPDDFEEDHVPKISDLRLFGTGGGSELIEWDIATSRIRQTINSQGGAIWSIAANPSSTMLALGCEDGTVRILSLENDTLTHIRRLGKVKSRMLSIAWGPPIPKASRTPKKTTNVSDSDDSDDDDDDEWVDSWLVTGCSDSSLRKWDVKTGQLLERMGTDKVRGERTLVWSVGVLGDGTIVSGDSMGVVKFWDSRTCTQLQSFQAHNADVLCLAISPEGTAVYTSGVDQKTVQFSLIKVQASTGASATKNVRWAQTSSKRMHSHDVRALAIWPPYTAIPPSFIKQQHKNRSYFPIDVAPVLASGGLDMNLVLAPAALPSSSVVKVVNPLNTSTVANFEDAYHRRVAYSLDGRVQVAKAARLVSCIREAGITIWRISKKPSSAALDVSGEDKMDEDQPGQDVPPAKESDSDKEPYAGGWERVLEMELSVTSNIVVHRISDDGSWLAVSDAYETKLFKLRTGADGQVTPKRVKNFGAILQPHIPPLPQMRGALKPQFRGTGSLALQFTPDSSKLVLSSTAPSCILIVDLTSEQPRVLRRFDHHLQVDSIVQDRVIAGGKVKSNATSTPKKPHVNGVQINGAVEDVEMKFASENESPTNEDEDSDDEKATSASRTRKLATIAVTHLAISPDGQWLASSSLCPPSSTSHASGPSSSSHHTSTKTHIYNLDSVAYHTTLPSFPLPIQHLAFASGTDSSSLGSGVKLTSSVLLLTFPNNSVQVYDVEQRQFPAWGKDLASVVERSRLAGMHDAVLGASFGSNPDTTDRFILFWSATWLAKISLDALGTVGLHPSSSSSSALGLSKGSSRKRRRGKDVPSTPNPKAHNAPASNVEGEKGAKVGATDAGADEDDGIGNIVKIISTYRPMLCAELLGPSELIVVERPLVDVLATLPPAYFKHRYGRS
ncbi:U3 small nucleolar RNA-associated protein 4 [Coprinopsis marcescibilis]|uniref:U3 small nucleolar RNA-associated protein 4 n=1 Tax=Coprinopsis marcescibilis TaxID=230819 RepID=A0A5C3KR82_COPMA|nr:U3 small nucleolar RNA-associated protein 4 [Coprinopsis marcescibilis]